MLSGRAVVLALAALVVGAVSCTPEQYARQADSAAYEVVAQKQKAALGSRPGLDITFRPLSVTSQAGDFFRGKPIPVGSQPARTLELGECLEIAFRNSRDFQGQKEGLYTKALALANLRHKWEGVGGNVGGAGNVSGGAVQDHSGTGDNGVNFARKFATGGAMTLAAGLNAANDLLNLGGTRFGSLGGINLSQPLWQGAWRDFAYEELYRAERDFAYAILAYQRYTQTFAVDTTNRYYRVLQLGDTLQNEQENLRRLEQTCKFIKAQVSGGMISRVQADQAEQDVLNARSRIETARSQYGNALDSFKIYLGLPLAASVEMDKAELEKLKPAAFDMDVEAACDTAMHSRPDVLNIYAGARDARRDVEIAADKFNPQINANAGGNMPGATNAPWNPQFNSHSRTLGLTVDYPLDQTDHRDAYRAALIADAKAQRSLDQSLDNVRLDVRTSHRALMESRRQYDIQKAAVALAQRRTTLAQLEQKEGLASTRDVLDAEDALRSSKNALTAALVDYVTTRLNFMASLGMISADPKGAIGEHEPQYIDTLIRPEPTTTKSVAGGQ